MTAPTTAATETPAGQTTTKLKGIRRTAAKRMVMAWEAPVFHLGVSADMTAALDGVRRPQGTTVTDVLLAACAGALAAHPGMNAHFGVVDGAESVTTFDAVNLGLAVATDAGLVVPVIHGAQDLDLEGIAAGRKAVVSKAREGKLGMADVTGGTFTVSNLGMLGIDRFDAILNVPQVAILAVGTTSHRQVWNDGDPQWRPLADVTLTCDHRAIDGATGAQFLSDLKRRLEAGGR